MKRIMFPAIVSFMLMCGCTAIDEHTDAAVAAGVTVQNGSSADTEETDMTDILPEITADENITASENITGKAESISAPEIYETENNMENTSEGGVESISLTFYEVTLTEGGSRMPIVTMYPESAPDKSEIWTSSDESVASVDGLGNITAVGKGKCTVTVASAACPDVTAQVSVTVEEVPGLTYIDGILIANKTYALPPDFNPGVDPDAQAAFDKMQAAAAEEGLNIYISSGFRSYEYQSGLYDRYVSRSGKAEADRYSARPGHSEHQTGLAFDLNTIDISFADTDEYEWVKANCAEYGFIIRYPEDGEEITGYMYEPWHIRYLGRETAKKVYDSGLTLEEYLGIDSKYGE